ncbi:MAG: hypothetical protein RLZZ244_2412, partial [Verrucomicrobiota bacterium]
MEEGAVGGGTRRRWRVFLWEPREARAEGEEKAGRLAGGRRIWGLAELEGAG